MNIKNGSYTDIELAFKYDVESEPDENQLQIEIDKLQKIKNKKELKKMTGIGSTTLTKLTNDEPVSMDVMIKICVALKCNIGDVMDSIKLDG